MEQQSETPHSQTAKKKAIFVDGENTRRMMQDILSIKADFRVLYEILAQEIGRIKVLAQGSPLIVIPPSGFGSFGHALSTFGFNVVEKDPKTEEDDLFIVQEIEKVDPSEVGEIIIVSADFRYIDCLLEKVRAGIKVYWVATKQLRIDDQRSMVGKRLVELLGNEFEFVELAKYKERLTLSPYVDRGPMTEVTVILKISRPRLHALKFADMIRDLQNSYKDLTFSVELKPVFEDNKRVKPKQQP